MRDPKASFPDDLHEHALAALAIKLAVENLFPRTKVQLSTGDCHDHFPAHDGAFEVSVSIVLRSIVGVLRVWLLRSEFLQPAVKILMQAGLVIVDEDAGADMHRVAEDKTFANSAFQQTRLHFAGDVHKGTARREIVPQFLPVAFHGWIVWGLSQAVNLVWTPIREAEQLDAGPLKTWVAAPRMSRPQVIACR